MANHRNQSAKSSAAKLILATSAIVAAITLLLVAGVLVDIAINGIQFG